MNTSLPPIASPNGQEAPDLKPHPDDQCARVAISLRTSGLLRYAIIEWLMPSIVAAVVIFPLFAAGVTFPVTYRFFGFGAVPLVFLISFVFLILIAAPITLLLRLCCKRQFEIWISEAGLFKCYNQKDIFFPWYKFMWVVERKGDVWLASFVDGAFIPREAFASREEAREFAAIMRELKRTRGAAWKDDWAGRVFGVTF